MLPFPILKQFRLWPVVVLYVSVKSLNVNMCHNSLLSMTFSSGSNELPLSKSLSIA